MALKTLHSSQNVYNCKIVPYLQSESIEPPAIEEDSINYYLEKGTVSVVTQEKNPLIVKITLNEDTSAFGDIEVYLKEELN